MDGWEFRIKWSHKDDEAFIVSDGTGFAEALAFAVKMLVREGRPWGQNDVGTIWMQKPEEWIAPERRPIMTFMPPQHIREAEDG
jgi:hypothetical protein